MPCHTRRAGRAKQKYATRLRQSSKTGSLSIYPGVKHGALPHEWAAFMPGLRKVLANGMCTAGVTLLRL